MTQCRWWPRLGTDLFNVACPNLLGPSNNISHKSVKSREFDQENGYENRSPVFRHKRWPTAITFPQACNLLHYLPSQRHHQPFAVTNYSVWWQRYMCVNNMPTVITWNIELNTLSRWFKLNKHSLNIKKTNFIIFRRWPKVKKTTWYS